MRIVLIGGEAWQIELAGPTWLKSIRDADAELTPIEDELLADTRATARGLGLEVAANDSLIDADGQPHLLEANHVPNVTRFEPIASAYLRYLAEWAVD